MFHVPTWSSDHRRGYHGWNCCSCCCCICARSGSTCSCSPINSDLEEAAQMAHEAGEVREVEVGHVGGLEAGPQQNKKAEDLRIKVF